jgi:hypothetical protein
VQSKPCETCHLYNDGITEDLALRRTNLAPACQKYEANACCSRNITVAIDTGQATYEPVFRWDRCYAHHKSINATLERNATLLQKYNKCEKWFQAEECLYECDVNAGKFRKFTDCVEKGEQSVSFPNSWQMQGMPIRASECDSFYDDCKDLIMCTCIGTECIQGLTGKSLFGMAIEGVCEKTDKYCKHTIGSVCAADVFPELPASFGLALATCA